MPKQLAALAAVAGAVASTAALALTPAASGASSMPTLHIALKGTKGITVSGSEVSGAVRVTSSFSGKAPTGPNANSPTWALVRLDPGVSLQTVVQAVNAAGGDLNALDPYASLFADDGPPQAVMTELTPGNYVALNATGNGQPGFATFAVTPSSSPAKLPAPGATETSIEFGFRGPSVLHNGEIVRAVNGGYLVHMDELFGVKSKADARKVIALLKAGKDNRAARYVTSEVNLAGPLSPGGMQELVLDARAGYYVQACFMDTQDGRDHTLLGMERIIKIVK